MPWMILCGEAVYGYVIRLVFREEKGAALERGQRKDGRKTAAEKNPHERKSTKWGQEPREKYVPKW